MAFEQNLRTKQVEDDQQSGTESLHAEKHSSTRIKEDTTDDIQGVYVQQCGPHGTGRILPQSIFGDFPRAAATHHNQHLIPKFEDQETQAPALYSEEKIISALNIEALTG